MGVLVEVGEPKKKNVGLNEMSCWYTWFTLNPLSFLSLYLFFIAVTSGYRRVIESAIYYKTDVLIQNHSLQCYDCERWMSMGICYIICEGLHVQCWRSNSVHQHCCTFNAGKWSPGVFNCSSLCGLWGLFLKASQFIWSCVSQWNHNIHTNLFLSAEDVKGGCFQALEAGSFECSAELDWTEQCVCDRRVCAGSGYKFRYIYTFYFNNMFNS